ncbi:hypothetical protein [Nitrospina gracilis]|nr:hypothetical protein [Nitrospina gracilis]MCF8720123.1 hypothetical protein [Nitrospina gracilis Nb-211]
MGNRFRERNRELQERGDRYKVHWFRKLLVWVLIIGFWILFYWSRS